MGRLGNQVLTELGPRDKPSIVDPPTLIPRLCLSFLDTQLTAA